MSLGDVLAAVMLGALLVYAVTGGADFGGGVWDLLARGPRAEAQRRLVEAAIAPIWEANHVWLVFVVVLLFSAFPAAFAAAGTALYAPLSIVLVGIVLRGAGFVFRQYGEARAAEARRWGRVFAVASTVSPFGLGLVLAAATGGLVRAGDGGAEAPVAAWLGPFPLLVGLFVVTLFAYLAAVYLAVEAPEGDLREDFRRRALAAGVALGALSLVVRAAAGAETPRFFRALYASGWSWACQITVSVLALAALAALWARRFRAARALAVGQAAGIVLGWGLAQYPYLIAPDVTIASAGAPPAVQAAVLLVVGGGGLLLAPALYYLLRVFKSGRGEASDAG